MSLMILSIVLVPKDFSPRAYFAFTPKDKEFISEIAFASASICFSIVVFGRAAAMTKFCDRLNNLLNNTDTTAVHHRDL
jgi:hypothetical protein